MTNDDGCVEDLVLREQQALLPSAGSQSLDNQVIYGSMESFLSNESEVEEDDEDPVDIAAGAVTTNNNHDNPNNDSACAADDTTTNVVDGVMELKPITIWEIICILSTAFSYGCILTTLFLITLPVECERIESGHPTIPKSVALGIFVSIAGITQLISPFVGRLSDTFRPPPPHDIGQRLPYLVLGSVLTVFGLLGQMWASYRSFWMRYSVAFFAHMTGLNIQYAMMLAIIPDQVPHSQTGIANGILAGLLVTGSLFGFGLFHGFLRSNITDMYGLYLCIVICSSILTGLYGHDKDVEMALFRKKQRRIYKKRTARSSPEATSRKHRMIKKIKKASRRVTQKVVVTPTIILRCMLVDPIKNLSCRSLCQSYTIDMNKHRDFFWVTVSRLFYYCGMSVQTFFMYFLHDIIHLRDDPEGAVATLSILGQLAGACTCVPVGIASDMLFSGKRKPFVYFSCFVLGVTTFAAIFAQTMQHMVIIMLVLGGANGIYLTMDTSLAVDTLPKDYDEDSGSAQLLGIWGVAAFLGSALGPMIGGPVLYFVGSQPTSNNGVGSDDIAADTSDQGYSLAGYAVILSLASFYFLLSSFFLNFVRR